MGCDHRGTRRPLHSSTTRSAVGRGRMGAHKPWQLYPWDRVGESIHNGLCRAREAIHALGPLSERIIEENVL